jgi:endonuclease/exonuclease/phosphatase family metal-dependent hydrolase
MSSRPFAALLAAALLVPSACVDAPQESLLPPMEPSASIFAAPGITVMTQNLYLGANIDLLFTASTPDEFALVFQQLLTSNAGGFGRALQIAMQIAEGAPHLVGLQEVTRYTFTTLEGTAVLDFLDILELYLGYLHAVGATPYTWTSIQNPLVASGPIVLPGLPVITYEGSNAILVRNDVQLLGPPTLAAYDAYETFFLAGAPLPFIRGYLAVTAQVEGHTIRFANTHLEVQRFQDTQVAQARQLIEELAASTVPVVLVGDFNSAANHDAARDEGTPTYKMLRNAGYADLWIREAGSVTGYTCCQGADLTNEVSLLDQRLDLVLVRYGNAGFGGRSMVKLIGNEPSDRITVEHPWLGWVTLWPSDHAGVAATIWPAPGLRNRW